MAIDRLSAGPIGISSDSLQIELAISEKNRQRFHDILSKLPRRFGDLLGSL